MSNSKRPKVLRFFMFFRHWRTGQRVYRKNGQPFAVWL